MALQQHPANALTATIIGAAIDVHRHLGPGLLESVYLKCLAAELDVRRVRYETNRSVPIFYRGTDLHANLYIDLMVDGQVVVEIKSVEKVVAVHEAQLLTYLKLTGCELGLLLNFNVSLMTDGITRKMHIPPKK